MGRVRSFLNRDAEGFFDQLARAELRFFRHHPWRAHDLGIAASVAALAVVWMMGGLRTVIVLFGAWLILIAVITAIAPVRMKRHR